jgi:hypothetical protein
VNHPRVALRFFFAAFAADFLLDFLAVFLPTFFAACFGAARLFAAGAIAIGGTIMGSETRPSAASGT